MDSPPPLACSVEGCPWTTPPNVPTWELVTTLMGQHTQAVHPEGGRGGNSGGEQDTVDNSQEMDQSSVDKIKLTKFGFGLSLIGFSSFLSIRIFLPKDDSLAEKLFHPADQRSAADSTLCS